MLKTMPGKILWFPWKLQAVWTVTCHIKLMPNNFLGKKQQTKKNTIMKFDSVCITTKIHIKFLTFNAATRRIRITLYHMIIVVP